MACGLEAVAIVRCESAHSRGAREQEGWLATLDAAVGGREPVTKAGRSRIGAIKQTDGVVTGNRTRVKIVKNKVAPPFTEAEFDIMYNEGISSTGALLDLALEKQIIEKRGSWLNYKGTQLAQGRDAAKEALKNDQALYQEIEAALKVKLDEDKR